MYVLRPPIPSRRRFGFGNGTRLVQRDRYQIGEKVLPRRAGQLQGYPFSFGQQFDDVTDCIRRRHACRLMAVRLTHHATPQGFKERETTTSLRFRKERTKRRLVRRWP